MPPPHPPPPTSLSSPLSFLPHPSLTVCPLFSLLFMLLMFYFSQFFFSLAVCLVSHSQFASPLFTPLFVFLCLVRAHISAIFSFALTSSSSLLLLLLLLSPSYIIFSLNTFPSPSSSFPLYLSLFPWFRFYISSFLLFFYLLLCPPHPLSPSLTCFLFLPTSPPFSFFCHAFFHYFPPLCLPNSTIILFSFPSKIFFLNLSSPSNYPLFLLYTFLLFPLYCTSLSHLPSLFSLTFLSIFLIHLPWPFPFTSLYHLPHFHHLYYPHVSFLLFPCLFFLSLSLPILILLLSFSSSVLEQVTSAVQIWQNF